MTEPTGGAAHLDPDTLADLDEDLLPGDQAVAARAHLAGCPRCRLDSDALAGVRDSLAGAAEVGAVPADVVARLNAALAAVADEPAGSAPTRTVTPLRTPAPSGPRGLRWLQAAAVAVLLLAGGALGVSALRGASGGDSGADLSSAGGGAADSSAKAASAAYPLTASGRDWTKESVTDSAPRLLAGTLSPTLAAVAPEVPDSSGGTADRELAGVPSARLAAGPALADCVTELAGGPVTPLALDLAMFEGEPAAVVLLPGLAGAGFVDIWVVPPDCAQGKGEFLYYASVPRP